MYTQESPVGEHGAFQNLVLYSVWEKPGLSLAPPSEIHRSFFSFFAFFLPLQKRQYLSVKLMLE